ncbi:hypothetical protein AB4212_43290 [Streptomyces sp. 2MCAF27]
MTTVEELGSATRTVSGRRLAALVRERCQDANLAHEVEVVSRVLPFKVSHHVIDHLVDWQRAPDDPLYRLVFPHRDMLDPGHCGAVERALGDPPALVFPRHGQTCHAYCSYCFRWAQFVGDPPVSARPPRGDGCAVHRGRSAGHATRTRRGCCGCWRASYGPGAPWP